MKKILHFPLEFNRFFSARKFPYPLGIGMLEGFKDIKHITIPALYHEDLWLKHAKGIVGNNKFDQVWIEVVHSQMTNEFLKWISTLAPVVVGFVVESLTIDPQEFVSNSKGTQRRVDNTNQKLPYLTHVIVTDERDLKAFDKPTMLGIASIPERLIKIPSGTPDKAIFRGTLYGDRGKQIEDLEHVININPPSDEDNTNFPQMFDHLFTKHHESYNSFFTEWFSIRQAVYSVWINCLYNMKGCGIVNPVHRTNVLSGRVIEGMAAGKPIISPLMNNNIDKLFTDCEDILYYENDRELYDCIITLQTYDDLRFDIAESARVNLLENHTTECRVGEILKFTKEGN